MKRNGSYAEVAVWLPVRSPFHYRVPRQLQGEAQVGMRVRVPFGRREVIGMLVGFTDRPEVQKLRPVSELLDSSPLLTPDLLELTRWISRTTLCSWGEAIAASLPGPLRRGTSRTRPWAEEPSAPPIPSQPLPLNAEQRRACEAIQKSIARHRHDRFLLHGVTGSGKTEVYLQAIRQILDLGRSCIVLVPEISLTPQAIERFQSRFGTEAVAVLHSAMAEGHRLHEWQRIRAGQARVVVGARSAVFAPAQNLGLLVVDEEHEPSYKQEDAPRYHAREVAIERARLVSGVVVLGSATPSIETFHQTTGRSPRLRLLELPGRIEEVPLPRVDLVDMRQEVTARHRIFSRRLEESIAQTLSQHEQAILFLNRRGFSTFVHCPRCGYAVRCPSCQLPLTYHMASRKLLCHHCSTEAEAPDLCPRCRSQYVRFQGLGTERVESELARLFPQGRIERMDSDATRTRGAHAQILGRFSRHEVDLLIGTQMVAKGLDFPRVTLVGVISADTALHLPDFRSAERTFQLLTQVAGRAGRAELAGRVIVQTYNPHHYAIEAAQSHDYLRFYQQELQVRRQLCLPPFSRLLCFTIRSVQAPRALSYAEKLAKECRQLGSVLQTIGPGPAPIPRLRRQYRWQILLKSQRMERLLEEIVPVIDRNRPPHGCRMAVDVDPL